MDGHRLTPADVSKVLAAAATLLDVSEGDDFGMRALGVVRDVIPCEVISYNEIDLPSGEALTIVHPESWIPVLHETWPVYQQAVVDHPIIVRAPGSAMPLRFEDVYSDSELFDTAFYRDFLSTVDLRYQLVVQLPTPAWSAVGVVLARKSGDPFTDREVALLQALQPHLVHAYRHAQLAGSHASLESAVTNDGWTVLSVDELGIVTKVNGDDGTALRTGERVPNEILHMLNTLKNDRQTRLPETTLPVAGRPTGVAVHHSADNGYLVLLRPDRADLRTVMSNRGFTDRQTDVAQELLVGGTNDQIADRLAISVGTVKKHLEAIYRNLDVNDRSSAIAAIAALVKAGTL